MKTILTYLLISLLLTLNAFSVESDFSYVNKGYEAFYIGPYDLKIVGPDLNTCIIVSATSIDTPKELLEADAIRIVDGLAAEPQVLYSPTPKKKQKQKPKPNR